MTCPDALRSPTARGDAGLKAPGPRRRVLAAALASALLGTLAGCASPPTAPSELATMRELIQTRYLSELGAAELDAPTPQALAKALDGQSRYYSASDLATLARPQDETVAGPQVGLDPRQDEVHLVTAIGGAADEAGLRTGDLLLSVDGEPVAGLATPAILARLRGEAGSRVDLVVLRPGVAEPIALTLQRRAGLLALQHVHRLQGGVEGPVGGHGIALRGIARAGG